MKRLTPALLTLVMFGVVGLLVLAYVAKTMLAVEEAPKGPRTRNVPMAIVDIPAGVEITENHVGQGPLATDELAAMPDVLLANRVIVGRVSKEAIKAAAPFRANQLYQPGEQPQLQVTPGLVAVSVSVGDSVAMVDGMIAPKQYVDVLFTFQGADDERIEGGLTMRLFEGVKVLAVNRNQATGRVLRTDNKVTLELTKVQATMLTLAKDRGEITLTYNPNGPGTGEVALSNADRVTFYELLGMKPPAPEKEPFLTETYKGKERYPNRFTDKGRIMPYYDEQGTAAPRQDRPRIPATTSPVTAEPSPTPAPTAAFPLNNVRS